MNTGDTQEDVKMLNTWGRFYIRKVFLYTIIVVILACSIAISVLNFLGYSKIKSKEVDIPESCTSPCEL